MSKVSPNGTGLELYLPGGGNLRSQRPYVGSDFDKSHSSVRLFVPRDMRYKNVITMASSIPAPAGRLAQVAGPSLPSPIDAARRVRAVLFDLDGTLYRQPVLRGLMALELATMPLYGPRRAARRWRALAAYRRAQEQLRSGDVRPESSQGAMAAAKSGLPVAEVEALAQEWMQVRPLKYLRACRAVGLDALVALGLTGRFSPVLSATDPEIRAFKPHPRGFLRAAAIWHLATSDVLVVGDRLDADAAGAAAAGMPCVIIGRARLGRSSSPTVHRVLPSLEALHHVLEHGR
jgi:phosphoglycolate phosphatase/putative hydrolase of the HAD superfamily